MENEINQSRREKIEQFLLDPDKVILEMLEGLDESTKELIEALRGVDLEKLETLRGEDGKTPERGIDYFTDEDLDNIEAFINSRIPKAEVDYPTPEQVNLYVDKKVKLEVSKLPLQKGDKGNPGKNGEPGRNGSPDTAEQILAKLRSLPKNKRLNVSDIRGLQTELNNIIQNQEASIEDVLKIIDSLKITIPSITSGGMSECNWGNIGGTLDNQTDLKAVLDTKLESLAGLITAGTNVTITGAGTIEDPFVINSTGGSGGGDVSGPASATADNIAVFDGITGKIIKDGGKKISELQTALGFTPENVSNKSTDIATDGASDTKYPSAKATKTYIDTKVGNAVRYQGAYDASGNTYPTTGGSGTAGAIMKGDMFVISVAGTLGGVTIQVGDEIIANVDTPGQTSSNWNTLNTNINYVPEDIANKKTTMTGNTTSDIFYLTAKAIYDWATGLFQTLGNLRTSFQATPTDTAYPSEKLVKDSLDAKVEDSIVDGHTTIAPSGNAVFDALALKATLAYPNTFTENQTIYNTFSSGDGGLAIIATQDTPNSSDTADNVLKLEYKFSANSANNSLINRIFRFTFENNLTGGGEIQNARLINLSHNLKTGTKTGNLENIYIESFSGGGTVTNGYGLHIVSLDGTNKYGIYDSSGGKWLSTGVYSTTVAGTNRDVYVDNTGLIGYVSSSLKYKNDVKDMENIDWLYNLRPVNFTLKSDENKEKQYGLIAEEVDEINKHLVSYDEEGEPETVNYSRLITPLLKAVQDQQKEIDLLKEEIKKLKK